MPWITTKSGKRINTDWFIDEDNKQRQIQQNQQQANKLNHPDNYRKAPEPDAHIEPFTRMALHLASKGISSEEEIANYLRGLSATRRSKLAREMGLESRGNDKIKEMAHRIYLASKNPNPNPVTPLAPKPEPKKVEEKKPEPTIKKAEKTDFPQEYKEILGEKKDVDAIEQLSKCREHKAINPNYQSYIGLSRAEINANKPYHTNCALCTCAIALQARGYNVEAMPRDTTWRGAETIFEFDLKNPDNFLIGGGENSWNNFAITRDIMFGARGGTSYPSLDQYKRMPRGARQASQAIIDKMTEWGDGAIAELSVDWKGNHSAHSVSVINQWGKVFIWDGQNNRTIETQPEIEKYLKRTTASHTQLVRLDNAPLKPNLDKQLPLMVKPKDTSVIAQLNAAMDNIDWNKF